MKTVETLRPGLTGCATLTVEADHTASHVGSGCEEVLATPVMIALMEAAAVDCVEHLLEAGQTSLGVQVAVEHTAATPVGRAVTATAELTAIEGRRLTFKISAQDETRAIGSGTHVRAVVSIDEFRRRLAGH